MESLVVKLVFIPKVVVKQNKQVFLPSYFSSGLDPPQKHNTNLE